MLTGACPCSPLSGGTDSVNSRPALASGAVRAELETGASGALSWVRGRPGPFWRWLREGCLGPCVALASSGALCCSPILVARPFRVGSEGVPADRSAGPSISATFVDGVPSQLFRWTVRSGLPPPRPNSRGWGANVFTLSYCFHCVINGGVWPSGRSRLPGRGGNVAPSCGSNLFFSPREKKHNSMRWITRLVRR